MINVIDSVKEAYDKSTTQIDKIVLNGNEYRISNVEYYDDVYSDGNIFGTAIAKCLEFEIENTIDLEQTEVEYFTGIVLNDGTTQWINLGNFIVQTVEPNDTTNINKVTAMDYMIKSNILYTTNLEYSNGEITLLQVLQEVCANSGLELSTLDFPNKDFIVDSNQFSENTLNRQVIQAVAQLSGTVAKIKNDNVLYLINPNENVDVVKTFYLNNYEEAEIKRNTHPINVVSLGMDNVEGENITLRDEESIQKNGENILTINDNPFAYTQAKREQLITALFDAVKGFEYTSFSFNCQGLPYLETLDKVQFLNKNGNVYNSYIFRFNYKSPNGLESSIGAPSITKATVNYQNIPTALEIAKRTEIVVDKHEQTITQLTQETTEHQEKIAQHEVTINSINSLVKLVGGNNKQINSLGAYGTSDFEQSEEGTIIATEEELIKTETDNGFGRIIYISGNKWFKFKSETLDIGKTYTSSFKYSNQSKNECIINLLNGNESIELVNTSEEKELENIEYTFIANEESIELYVSTGDGTAGITDYYIEESDTANKWQPASGETLSTVLAIYYNGIQVTSENSEIITNISNLGFSVTNKNGKVLITFNKDKCILSDTEIDGVLEQSKWLRYVQSIKSKDVLLEVKI